MSDASPASIARMRDIAADKPSVPAAKSVASDSGGVTQALRAVPVWPSFAAGAFMTGAMVLVGWIGTPPAFASDRWRPALLSGLTLLIHVAITGFNRLRSRAKNRATPLPLRAIPVDEPGPLVSETTRELEYRQFDKLDQKRGRRSWIFRFPWVITLLAVGIGIAFGIYCFRDGQIERVSRVRVAAILGAIALADLAMFIRLELIFAAAFPITVGVLATGMLADPQNPTSSVDLLSALLGPIAVMSAINMQRWMSIYRSGNVNGDPISIRTFSRWQRLMSVAVLLMRAYAACFLIAWLAGPPISTGISILMLAMVWAVFMLVPLLMFFMPINGQPPETIGTLLNLPASPLKKMRRLYTYQQRSVTQYAFWKTRVDPIFQHIESTMPAAGSILDAGCGYGLMSALLAMQSLDRQLIGVDLHVPKINVARAAGRSLRNVRYELADLLAWDIPTVDAMLMVDISHYWTADKQRSLIAKAAAALRPGGVILFRERFLANGRSDRILTPFEKIGEWLNINPRGDGLMYQDGAFYRKAFEDAGLTVEAEHADWGLGQDTVLIVRKALPLFPSPSGRGFG